MSNLIYKICNKTKIKPVKLIVCDMAGTTINEGGIVYDTLYETMKNFGLTVSKNEKKKWYGKNKYEVLNNYLTLDNKIDLRIKKAVQSQLHTNFDNNLKEKYFFENNIKLIHYKLPELFNNIRKKNVKISLNTGYNKEIQESIINKLNMNEFIDNYISSEEVKFGRPLPYMINRLIDKNNIKKTDEVIKIGDTQIDILEGKNANCGLSIGVLTGACNKYELAEADLILNSVMDLRIT
tara:strand:+ start:2627 stop:3337 length:711 start_codon:yes stop_codon:yes gene_type:complete